VDTDLLQAADMISRTLIDEIGIDLNEHIQSTYQCMSWAMAVVSAFIEMRQNIPCYTSAQGCGEPEATAKMVIAELSQGSYVEAAGNVVELADVQLLLERVA
jgi:hypothetical protein